MVGMWTGSLSHAAWSLLGSHALGLARVALWRAYGVQDNCAASKWAYVLLGRGLLDATRYKSSTRYTMTFLVTSLMCEMIVLRL